MNYTNKKLCRLLNIPENTIFEETKKGYVAKIQKTIILVNRKTGLKETLKLDYKDYYSDNDIKIIINKLKKIKL